MARIGISDVAAVAGVSTSTVSVILNNVESARVSPRTRERVWQVAADLGYVPNGLARGLRLRRSDIIGFVSDSVATTPYAGRMILGAQEAGRSAGRLLLSVDTAADAEVERAALTSLLQRQVDGVLYAAMYHRKVALPALLATVPTVVVNATSDDPGVSAVVPDESGGVRLAVRELVEAGHRRIGYVSTTARIPATPMRRRAFGAALRAHGLTPRAEWIRAHSSDAPGGYAAGRQILSAAERPTGVFCFNDTMALGVYQAAHELGLRIPADLSVVGFDNLELIAGNLLPGLTTVSLPHYEMGAWAARQLLAEIDDPAARGRRLKLVGKLYRRDSVAPPG